MLTLLFMPFSVPTKLQAFTRMLGCGRNSRARWLFSEDIHFVGDMFSNLFTSLWVSMSDEERNFIGGLPKNAPFLLHYSEFLC